MKPDQQIIPKIALSVSYYKSSIRNGIIKIVGETSGRKKISYCQWCENISGAGCRFFFVRSFATYNYITYTFRKHAESVTVKAFHAMIYIVSLETRTRVLEIVERTIQKETRIFFICIVYFGVLIFNSNL